MKKKYLKTQVTSVGLLLHNIWLWPSIINKDDILVPLHVYSCPVYVKDKF